MNSADLRRLQPEACQCGVLTRHFGRSVPLSQASQPEARPAGPGRTLRSGRLAGLPGSADRPAAARQPGWAWPVGWSFGRSVGHQQACYMPARPLGRSPGRRPSLQHSGWDRWVCRSAGRLARRRPAGRLRLGWSFGRSVGQSAGRPARSPASPDARPLARPIGWSAGSPARPIGRSDPVVPDGSTGKFMNSIIVLY